VSLRRRAKGVIKRVARAIRRRLDPARLEIVLYHLVSDRDDPFTRSGHTVSTAAFRAQLRWLRRTHELVRLRDLPELEARPGGRPYAAICFDDGYANNLREAYPILEREGVPATTFVCPSVLDNRAILWRDQIRYLIERGLDRRFVDHLRGLPDRRYRFDDLAHTSFYRWSKEPRSIGDMSIQRDLDDFFAREGLSTAELARRHELFMAADDLRAYPFLDFGNHTWSHPVLTALSAADQRREIAGAHDFLVARGLTPVGLAMPFAPYNADTTAICAELGYRMMFAVGGGNRVDAAAGPGVRVLRRRMAPTTAAGLREIV
jgi:peptidoglycan/xylan/chitin deacetylase (PgdA/CDA1 family)